MQFTQAAVPPTDSTVPLLGVDVFFVAIAKQIPQLETDPYSPGSISPGTAQKLSESLC
ncbi:hypothetical protein NG799_17425 [Laspinema sp. D1]|uniref:Uncharacterized protein n=1 Tax=Laspinema palackyanum D2a TaxID=2953684 RepID=A0ABT2MTM7_9CYAN|nr:hypothetical protein [Laspinema sp. D2b]MCT7968096.1 hypothetical protein [Laspinema sp. D2a]